MADSLLDDPGLVEAREGFWLTALTDPVYRRNIAAVSEVAGEVVGIAMSGPAAPESADWQLFVLYVLADHHGTGAGAALLSAVIPPERDVSLWVADPNPRAQAFYRRHGFVPDGAAQTVDGVDEIRMIRAAGDSQPARNAAEPRDEPEPHNGEGRGHPEG
ncbi:MAG TPA: GNAT family N-acetyltransferase [Naasia sp.]